MIFFIFFTISGRSIGLASVFSTQSRGFECIEWNPANLAFAPKFSFNILNLGVFYYANLPYSKYIDLFAKGYWDEADKQYFRYGEDVDIQLTGQSLSFSFKNFAFSTYIYSKVFTKIPPGVCSLFLWGNEIDRTYKFDGIKFKYENTAVFTFSCGGVFSPLAMGISVKYLLGLDYREVDKSTGFLTTTFDYITGEGEIIYKYANEGNGLAIDFGLIYLSKDYKIGISVINLINTIRWHSNPTITKYSFKLDTTNVENFDPNYSLNWQASTYKINSFNTTTDLTLRIGGSMVSEKITISGDVGMPLFVGIAAEIHISIFDFRLGCSYYKNKTWLGIGAGIKTLPSVDLGIKISSNSRVSVGITVSGFSK